MTDHTGASKPKLRIWAVVLLAVSLVLLGAVLADDYGISWDVISEREYARDSLASYQGSGPEWERYGIRRHYGPAYLMGFELLSQGLSDFVADWTIHDAGHFTNFLTFLLGGMGLYSLSGLFVSTTTQLLITALFLTQPLLFGHGFINHKDAPFMSFFLVTMALAFRGWRRLKASERSRWGGHPEGFFASLSSAFLAEWRQKRAASRALWMGAILALALLLLELFIAQGVVRPALEGMIQSAYHGRAWGPLNALFSRLAERSADTPLDAYLLKFDQNYSLLSIAFGLTAVSVVAAGAAASLPSVRSLLGKELIARPARGMKSRWFVLFAVSAVLGGFGIAMRPFGAAALAIGGLMLLRELRTGAPLPIAAMLLISVFTAGLVWPSIGGNAAQGFLDSLNLFADHPWEGFILFEGTVFAEGTTPVHYLPFFLLIQLTEPVIIFGILGAVIVALRRIRYDRAELAVLAGWLFIPPLVAMAAGSIVFDNARQFLFAVPPLFILAGIGLDYAVDKLSKPSATRLAAWILILPGIIAIIRLHPYQYVYYNSLVGGMKGASQSFEMDYWCTSYRAAFEYINEHLPTDAKLAVSGAALTAREYARVDLQVFNINETTPVEDLQGKYLLLCLRHNIDDMIQAKGRVIHFVEVLGVPLSVLYGIPETS